MPLRLLLISLALSVPVFAVKVGYNDNPPQMYRDANGLPAGFVVDLVNEAARRTKIPIEWVYLPNGASLDLFARNVIDLWPAGVSTPARRKVLHATRPWWKIDVLLLTHDGVAGSEDLAGRRVGITPQMEDAVSPMLPSTAHKVFAETQAALARQLCRGELDAIATDRLVADRLLLNRPKECSGVRLRMFGLPGALVDLSILSHKEDAASADRLQAALEGLSRDGTTTSAALRYAAMSGASAGFVALLVETQHRNRELQAAVLLAACLLLASAVVVYAMARNVARRKRVEADLRRTNADLEQFNWAVHHDLREPVRNISILTEFLDSQPQTGITPDMRQRLQWIGDGARRIARLLDSLGRYTDLWNENGPPSATQVSDALADALANLRTELDQSSAVVEADPPLPTVRYSHGQLVQILQNLIANAIKYRGSEPLKIRISARQHRKEHVISVQDNGIGISAQHHDRIFRMFKRLHGAEIQGTGVGLAICRNIVERNGGRIWVESEPGRGSCFSFSIPMERNWTGKSEALVGRRSS